jgi:uncharacterized protein (DUF2267 family)
VTAPAARDDETARSIERAVLDYFEGWFDGDAARMEAALHPELAKRTFRDGALETITAQQMIDATAEGMGRALDVPDRAMRISITEVDRGNATVVVHSALYIEYVHLVETGDGWKIVNTLWRRA